MINYFNPLFSGCRELILLGLDTQNHDLDVSQTIDMIDGVLHPPCMNKLILRQDWSYDEALAIISELHPSYFRSGGDREIGLFYVEDCIFGVEYRVSHRVRVDGFNLEIARDLIDIIENLNISNDEILNASDVIKSESTTEAHRLNDQLIQFEIITPPSIANNQSNMTPKSVLEIARKQTRENENTWIRALIMKHEFHLGIHPEKVSGVSSIDGQRLIFIKGWMCGQGNKLNDKIEYQFADRLWLVFNKVDPKLFPDGKDRQRTAEKLFKLAEQQNIFKIR